MEMDVEVQLLLGLNEESEEALRVVWNVAQKLRREHNIWIAVIPTHVLWSHDPLAIDAYQLPQILIDGEVYFTSTVPDPEELESLLIAIALRKKSGKGKEEVIEAT